MYNFRGPGLFTCAVTLGVQGRGVIEQEIYRPGTAISHASNLCTAVGGDQNASFLREKGPRGWNKNILILYFPY